MWFVVIGVILLLLKWLELGPVATWSWWIVLAPFALALVWFEVLEPLLGLDKKKAHSELDKIKEERIKKSLQRPGTTRRR